MKFGIPLLCPIGFITTACSETDKDTSADATPNSPIVGDWECTEMDGISTPMALDVDDPQLNQREGVASLSKEIFMHVEEDLSGELNSHFLYTYENGNTDLMEAPLPMTVTDNHPSYAILSQEGHGEELDIAINCQLTDGTRLSCDYTVGGDTPPNASMTFEKLSPSP